MNRHELKRKKEGLVTSTVVVAITPTAKFVFWLNQNFRGLESLLGMNEARENPTIMLIAGEGSDSLTIFDKWIGSHWLEAFEDVLRNLQPTDRCFHEYPTFDLFRQWFDFTTYLVDGDYSNS